MTTKTRTSTEAGGDIECGWRCEWLCERCDYPDCKSYMPPEVKPEVEVTEYKQLTLFEI